MTIQLGELQQCMNALRELSALKFPAKVSYRLSRVLKSAESEMEHLRTAHFALVQSLGEKAEGDKWKVKPECLEQFQREMGELLAESIELWGDPLPLDLLGDVHIEPSVLANLDWLITDGEQANAPGLINGKANHEEATQ